MAFEGQVKCAVPGCDGPCSDGANLCEKHLVTGLGIKCGDGTGVVTFWYAEHAGERGIVLLNDFALGDLFGGADGFRAELKRQGFSAIRILKTPEEFANAQAEVAKAPGIWGGPWETQYPWKTGTQSAERMQR